MAIIGCIIYFKRRQIKKSKQRKSELIANEAIQVDWDKIDNQYREIEASASPVSANSNTATKVNSPQLLNNTDPSYINGVNYQTGSYNRSPDVPDENILVKPSVAFPVEKPGNI